MFLGSKTERKVFHAIFVSVNEKKKVENQNPFNTTHILVIKKTKIKISITLEMCLIYILHLTIVPCN